MLKIIKKKIAQYTPSEAKARDSWFGKIFGNLLKDEQLWKLTRRSVPGAFAIGLFCAFFPIPGQMLLAGLIAIYFRKNIPISLALIWITNPLTIPPIFFFNYRIGAFLLRMESIQIKFEPTTQWLIDVWHVIWWPLLFGSLIIGTLLSAAGYIGMVGLWRLAVVFSNRKRLKRNKDKILSDLSDDSSSAP